MLKMPGVSVLCAVTGFMTVAATQGLAKSPDTPAAVDAIPPQSLGHALQLWAEQTGWQLMYDPSLTANQQTQGAPAGRIPLDGLTRILDGTGLSYRFLNDRTVAILGSTDSPRAFPTSLQRNAERESSHTRVMTTGREAAVDDEGGGGASDRELTEVIVTAQKRAERLQDVPVPVTAITADNLVDRGQLRLQDYYANVPGLNMVSNGVGDAKLSIRGVTTGGITNPTVGVTVDDVPFGTSTGFASQTWAPDIDPSELKRVEVLRGPQGTLYGASSIGGLLKYVTVDPTLDQFAGRLQADLNGVRNGEGNGYGLRGSVNMPIGDTFAVRASGFTRRDPGYIDDPLLGIEGVNEVDVYGGRLSALWRPSDTWSVKLSALLQNTKADGTSDITLQPGLNEFQQVFTLPGKGYEHKVQAYSATLASVLGSVELTSISGYSLDDYDRFPDISNYYGDGTLQIYNVTGAQVVGHSETRKFTQEVRLAGTFSQRYDWLAGVYYAHDDNNARDRAVAVDATTLIEVGPLLDDSYPTTFSERAVFGDLTVHFTDRFDVQFGGRESQNRQVYQETISGPLWGFWGLEDPSINPPVHTKDNSFTYLLTPRFKISPETMAYARFASGYRPGGPNPTCILFPTPCQYAPDKTQNYELGIKGELFDRLVSYDASVYYIDWKEIQLQVSDATTGFIYYTNASSAKSRGIELAANMRPVHGLSVGGWIALNDAELTSDLPPTGAIGFNGDRLPYSSRFSGNLSVEQALTLTNDVDAFFGGAVSYVGDRKNNFATAALPDRLDLPSYTLVNLRAGLRYDRWALNLFINNVGDKRGVLSYPQNSPSTFGANYIQPRSFGVSVARTF